MKDNDYVDVRVMFPNGEDYIVAAKKSLQNVNILLNSCYLWLTEDENDLLSAAIVDANINGAKIYVNRYVRPEVQDANIVTYNPNADVIAAMQMNPNIVEEAANALSETARKDTEKRLSEFRELYPEYIIDDQLVDDVSRQEFVTGVMGALDSATDGGTSGSANIDITQPLPDASAGASTDASGASADGSGEEVDFIE